MYIYIGLTPNAAGSCSPAVSASAGVEADATESASPPKSLRKAAHGSLRGGHLSGQYWTLQDIAITNIV